MAAFSLQGLGLIPRLFKATASRVAVHLSAVVKPGRMQRGLELR
jgi:hypothetical protein